MNDIPANRTLYGVREAAEFIGVSRETVRRWLKLGLPHKVERAGHITTVSIQSDDLFVFNTYHDHKRGPKPQPRK